MVRRKFFISACVGTVAALGSTKSAMACLFWQRRRYCPPAKPKYREPASAGTVEELANLLISLKKAIDGTVQASARTDIDAILTRIMGDPNRLITNLANEQKVRVEPADIRRLFSGEVASLSDLIRALNSN